LSYGAELNRNITIYYDFEVDLDNSPNSFRGVRAISIGEDRNMEELDWFVSVLDNKFQVKISQDQIGYEGTECIWMKLTSC
jgi:hypothetical protein